MPIITSEQLDARNKAIQIITHGSQDIGKWTVIDPERECTRFHGCQAELYRCLHFDPWSLRMYKAWCHLGNGHLTYFTGSHPTEEGYIIQELHDPVLNYDNVWKVLEERLVAQDMPRNDHRCHFWIPVGSGSGNAQGGGICDPTCYEGTCQIEGRYHGQRVLPLMTVNGMAKNRWMVPKLWDWLMRRR